jgi:hypothetical protein
MKTIRIIILLQFMLSPNAYSKDLELSDLISLSIKNNPLIASQEASLNDTEHLMDIVPRDKIPIN